MTHKTPERPTTVEAVWFRPPAKLMQGVLAVGGLGLIFLGVGWMIHGDPWRRFQLGYLVALTFVLSLSLGSLFLVLIQHLMRAGWSVAIRRPAEIFSANLVVVALLALPLAGFVWRGELYPWAKLESPTVGEQAAALSPVSTVRREATKHSVEQPTNLDAPGDPAKANHDPHQGEHHSLYVHQELDELTRSKQSWLNRPWFLIRMAIYFAVWLGLAMFYFRQSTQQDRSVSSLTETLAMERWAGPGLLAFAGTLTLASFDWLMSLDPHWYSTIFGVYYFAGCVVGSLALLNLVWQLARYDQKLSQHVSVEHYRDLGRLLFAFVFFWGYIAFSQYMLLWYANIPETTRWLVIRGASTATGYTNSWGLLLIALLFGHFIVPFLGLMSRHVKASPKAMIFWTVWLLVFHYCDLFWIIMPEFGPGFSVGLIEIGCGLVVGSVWTWSAIGLARRVSLLPVGDPRLGESIRLVDAY